MKPTGRFGHWKLRASVGHKLCARPCSPRSAIVGGTKRSLPRYEFLPRSVVIVAPTWRSARAASFRPEAEVVGETTRILFEQMGAADAQSLGELAGHLTNEEMWGVDDALEAVLGLSLNVEWRKAGCSSRHPIY